jgi:hypothetical protein
MKPRRAVANGSAPADSDSAVDLNGNGNSTGYGHKSSSLATDLLPTVKVNNANLGEIKGALDEIVKKVGNEHVAPCSRASTHMTTTTPLIAYRLQACALCDSR